MSGSGITWVDREGVLKALSEAAREAKALGASEVWLFGSWAWGTPTPASDVDVLVVAPGLPKNPLERRLKFGRPFVKRGLPVDLVVLSPEEARDNPLYQLAKRGRRLA